MSGQGDEGSQLGMGVWKRLNACETPSQQPRGAVLGTPIWNAFPQPSRLRFPFHFPSLSTDRAGGRS